MARRIYRYNLGGNNNVAPQPAAPAVDSERERMDSLRAMHENLRDSLAQQGERLKAAIALDSYTKEMQKMSDQEQMLTDSAKFRSVYRLLKDTDPNRNAQISELFSAYPGASKNPEVQKDISKDDKRIAASVKPELTKEESDFLKNHGPGTKNFETTRQAVANKEDPNHINAVFDFKRAWDLKRKAAGLPSDTAGMSVDQMDQYLTGKQQPQTQPTTPTTAVPPPSTPASENVAGWSNANITPAPAAPATAPTATPNPVQEFIQKSGLMKTSDARSDLNDMLNESPETQVLAPKGTPPPAPTPKPTPAAAAPPQEYFTA
jgi:hypothetical protein